MDLRIASEGFAWTSGGSSVAWFLVPRDRLPGVDELMTHLGYELRYRHEPKPFRPIADHDMRL